MSRTWDQIVTDLETVTAEARAKADEGGTTPTPPTGDVIPVTSNLPQAIKDAPVGSILDLQGLDHPGPITVDKQLTIQNGKIIAGPNVNDLVLLKRETVRHRATGSDAAW